MGNNNTTTTLPSMEHDLLLDNLEVFKVEDRPDNRGRKILRIIGKFFPARVLKGAEGEEALKKYLERRIFPHIGEAPFCVLYVHSCVRRADNFPAFRLSDRSTNLCLPPLGIAWRPFISSTQASGPVSSSLPSANFSSAPVRLYGKLNYVSRLEFLREYMSEIDIEMPEFVYDHDDELEGRPLMDYGIESNRYNREYEEESAAPMFWLRNIS